MNERKILKDIVTICKTHYGQKSQSLNCSTCPFDSNHGRDCYWSILYYNLDLEDHFPFEWKKEDEDKILRDLSLKELTLKKGTSEISKVIKRAVGRYKRLRDQIISEEQKLDKKLTKAASLAKKKGYSDPVMLYVSKNLFSTFI